MGGQGMDQGLAMMAPPGAEVRLGDQVVRIGPMTILQVARLLPVVEPLLDQLVLLDPALLERLKGGGAEFDDIAQLVRLLVANGEKLIEAVTIASGQPPAAVQALLPDAFVQLLGACVRVNGDFFAQAAPALKASLAGLMPPKGPAPGRGAPNA